MLRWSFDLQILKWVVADMFQKKYMAHILVQREIDLEDRLPQDYLEPIKALWQDRGVRNAIVISNKYAIHDNLA